MQPYITPDRVRSMYIGTSVAKLTDLELASVLGRVTSTIHSYCVVPTIPQAHDFRGGSITGEEHQWRTSVSPFEPGQTRAYPFHWPVKAVSSFRIYVTATQYVDIPSSALVVRNSGRYIEVVSLVGTAFGLFNTSLLLPMLYLATPTVRLDYTYGITFTATGEPLYSSDGLTYRALDQWWDSTADVHVYRSGNLVDPAEYSVNYNEGFIRFGTAIPDSTAAPDPVTADFTYRLDPDIRDAAAHILRWEIAQSRIAERGMTGLTRMRLDELEIEATPHRGAVVAENLEMLVPAAAELLYGHKFIRAAGS